MGETHLDELVGKQQNKKSSPVARRGLGGNRSRPQAAGGAISEQRNHIAPPHDGGRLFPEPINLRYPSVTQFLVLNPHQFVPASGIADHRGLAGSSMPGQIQTIIRQEGGTNGMILAASMTDQKE
jgi:hypothetical protein